MVHKRFFLFLKNSGENLILRDSLDMGQSSRRENALRRGGENHGKTAPSPSLFEELRKMIQIPNNF